MTTWVLLRGLAREARHWGAFRGLLAASVPAGDEVVAVDLAGNGSRRHLRTPSTVHGIAQDVRRAVAASHPPPYVLVAVSLGGMVATEWALRHPAEVQGCVLVNSSLGRFSPPWHRMRTRALLELAVLSFVRDAQARERRVLRLTSNLPVDAETAAAWARYARESPVARLNAWRQLWAAAGYRPPRRRPGVPLLLLASTHDRLVDVRCSRALAQAWACPLHEHPRAGHDLPLDDPRWIIARLRDWPPPRTSPGCGSPPPPPPA